MPSFIGCHHPRKEGPKKTHRHHPVSVSDADAERWLDVAVPTHLTSKALMSGQRDVLRLFRIPRLQVLNSLTANYGAARYNGDVQWSRGQLERDAENWRQTVSFVFTFRLAA